MKTVAMVTGTSRGLTLAKKAPKYYSFELIFLESTTAYEVLHGIFLFLLTSGFNRKNKIGWQPWPLNIMGFQISHTFCFIFSCFGDISTYACYISINIFFFLSIYLYYIWFLCVFILRLYGICKVWRHLTLTFQNKVKYLNLYACFLCVDIISLLFTIDDMLYR